MRDSTSDRSLDLLKQRSHVLFGRDLALGDTHCSAGLHERHIGDADETQDVPKIGNFVVRSRSITLPPGCLSFQAATAAALS